MKFHFQIVTGLILSLFILAEAAESVVPFFANYRGRLVDDSGAPLTGSYSITFNLYTQPLGGVAVWTETHTGVAVSDGLFTVGLGTLTPLAGIEVPGDEFWIGITVGSDPELAPRTRVLSTFFAFSAGKADYADTAGFSNVADRARFADTADYSNTSGNAGFADTAGFTWEVADFSVSQNKLAGGSVTTDKLAVNSVQTFNIAHDAVQAAQIQDSSVAGSKVATGAITQAHLSPGAVNSAVIADKSILFSDISQNGALINSIMKFNGADWIPAADENTQYDAGSGLNLNRTTFSIPDGALTGAHLQDSTVSGIDIAAGAIASSHIQAGAITTSEIADNSVTSSDVQNGSLTGADIAGAAIASSHIQAGAVTASEIADNSITGADVQNGSLTGTDILTASITGSDIAAASIPIGDLDFVPGDISGITAGAGLIGGGVSGDIGISLAATIAQSETFQNTVVFDSTVEFGQILKVDGDRLLLGSVRASLPRDQLLAMSKSFNQDVTVTFGIRTEALVNQGTGGIIGIDMSVGDMASHGSGNATAISAEALAPAASKANRIAVFAREGVFSTAMENLMESGRGLTLELDPRLTAYTALPLEAGQISQAGLRETLKSRAH